MWGFLKIFLKENMTGLKMDTVHTKLKEQWWINARVKSKESYMSHKVIISEDWKRKDRRTL